MSLNYDLSKIKDYDAVCWTEAKEDAAWSPTKKGDKVMNPITNALIWVTMQIGIGEITEENAVEFYSRIHFSEKLFGTNLSNGGEPYFLTFEDVRRHIGLKTNVFPKETDAKWGARLIKTFVAEQRSKIERAAKNAARGEGS